MIPITPASLRLVTPRMELVTAYIEAQRRTGDRRAGASISDTALEAMAQVLERYVAMASVSPSPGETSTYQQLWLVAGPHYVGRVSLRRDIGLASEAMEGHIAYEVRPEFRRRGFGHRALTLGIEELRRQGVGDVLILCEADNIASIKIVEAAGGALESFAPHRHFPEKLIRRYWIRQDCS